MLTRRSRQSHLCGSCKIFIRLQHHDTSIVFATMARSGSPQKLMLKSEIITKINVYNHALHNAYYSTADFSQLMYILLVTMEFY